MLKLPFRAIFTLLCTAGSLFSVAEAAVSEHELTKPVRILNSGRFFVDEEGNTHILRGVNVVVKIPPYTPQSVGFDERTVRFLHKSGVNVVRLGILWAGVEPEPGVYDDAYIEQILETARLLAKYNIYSLLDPHQDMFNEKYQGEGFPAWAIIDFGLPNPQDGFPFNYFFNEALQAAFESFWNNLPAPDGIGIQDHYVKALRHIAEKFKDKPYIFGYDTLNEPFSVKLLSPDRAVVIGFVEGPFTNFLNSAIRHIREVDTKTLVLYQHTIITSSLVPLIPLVNLIPDPRMGGLFSQYCSTTEFAPCAPGIITQLNSALPIAFDRNNPFFVSEWSNDVGQVGDALTVTQRADIYDEYFSGWTYWELGGYPDPTTTIPPSGNWIFDITQPYEGSNLTATYRELIRPYPQLIAGTPIKFSYDVPSNTFRLEYSTKSPSTNERLRGGRTVIYVPELRFPKGYKVSVRGGKRLESKNRQYVLIQNKDDAANVEVKITPLS